MRRPARTLVLVAAGLLLLLIIGRAAAVFYTEVLWYSELGHLGVFWARIRSLAMVRAVTAAIGAAVVWINLWRVARHLGPVHLRRRYGNLEIAEQVPRRYVTVGIAAAAVFAGWWLSELIFPGSAIADVRAWLHGGAWGVTDPVFERDLGFYVFALPVYGRLLDFLLLVSLWSLLLTAVGYVLVGAVRLRDNRLEIDETPRLHFAALVAGIVLLIGARFWLGRYGVLLEGTGFADAVGYTDLHARLPAQRVLAILSIAVAGALLYGAWRRIWWPPLAAVGVLTLASVALGYVYPSIVQQFQVEPNQLAREAPYVDWNITFTRQGYDLQRIERRAFAYDGRPVGSWDDLGESLERVPLWDLEFLQRVMTQWEARTAYYEFPSVHMDRYGPPGSEEPVAIAVREFKSDGLPAGARTWRNLHLNARQVRGVGAVVAPVAEKTARADAVLWLREIEPVQRHPDAPASLDLTQSSVFFGETTTGYVILGSSAQGDTASLAPDAGIRLTSFLRTLAFAWRFSDRNLLFASELDRDSRLIFRRRVSDRLSAIAPFILWDSKPLPVIFDRRIVWMVDGYSASDMFPLATEGRLGEIGPIRYIRNSVKATVDAVTGDVTLYALRDEEPMLAAYRRAFPGLFRPLEELPAQLRSHIRYPTSLARLQATILEQYHVDSPETFITGRDAWQIPPEGNPQGTATTIEPVDLVVSAPGESRPDFWLTVPFNALERQNMTAMLYVRHGADRLGEMILLEFPRGNRVPGPTQVRAIVEQDPTISSQLSLWRRTSGSEVHLGRIRVLPLDGNVLYVQPLFLSATQTGSVPQLPLVVVSDGTSLNMEPTLAAAVDGLYDGTPRTRRPEVTAEEVGVGGGWADQALQLLDQARERLREGDFAGFGDALEQLERLLRQLSSPAGTG
jgi:hypothetical protein